MCSSVVVDVGSGEEVDGGDGVGRGVGLWWFLLFVALGVVLCLFSFGSLSVGLVGGLLFVFGVVSIVGGLAGLVIVVDCTGFFSYVQRLRKDRSGLAYQLVVFVVGLGVFSFVWFALGWPAELITSFFAGLYVFSGFEGTAFFFAQSVIRLLPAIVFFILLLELWVSSHRRVEGYF